MTVYLDYAFTPDCDSKQEANDKLYRQLKQKYKICQVDIGLQGEHKPSYYDLYIIRTPKYGHSEYQVLNNGKPLTPEEILLICAEGRLYFGGRQVYPTVYEVFED